MKKTLNSNGFGLIGVLVVVLVVIVLGGAGAYVYHRDHKAKPSTTSSTSTNSKTSTSTTTKPPAPADPYAGWKTYTSTQEKATFKYPSDWIVDTASQYPSNDSNNTDYTALKSPDGKVIVRWTSMITGFGNESGTSYPLHEVVNKTPIPGATGDYVVSAVTTLDGSIYYPWIAVANDPSYGILSSGVQGSLGLFMGRNNLNSSTGNHDTALFSVSGPRVNEGAPALTQAQARAYLSDADMQQAKLILLSLAY